MIAVLTKPRWKLGMSPIVLAILCVGCRGARTDSPRMEAHPSPAAIGGPAPAAVDSAQDASESGSEGDDPRRWLFVEKYRKDRPGGGATGSFDPEKNKLIIQTRDIRQFAIETARIPINWERLVIISIDGRNSELRQRDYTRLRFVLDPAGQWIVDER